jgi:hypothetical protein
LGCLASHKGVSEQAELCPVYVGVFVIGYLEMAPDGWGQDREQFQDKGGRNPAAVVLHGSPIRAQELEVELLETTPVVHICLPWCWFRLQVSHAGRGRLYGERGSQVRDQVCEGDVWLGTTDLDDDVRCCWLGCVEQLAVLFLFRQICACQHHVGPVQERQVLFRFQLALEDNLGVVVLSPRRLWHQCPDAVDWLYICSLQDEESGRTVIRGLEPESQAGASICNGLVVDVLPL